MSVFNTPRSSFSCPAPNQAEKMDVEDLQSSLATLVAGMEKTSMWTQDTQMCPTQSGQPDLPTEVVIPKPVDSGLEEIVGAWERKNVTSHHKEKNPRSHRRSRAVEMKDIVMTDAGPLLDAYLDEILTDARRRKRAHPTTNWEARRSGVSSEKPSAVRSTPASTSDMDIDEWSMSKELRMELAKRRAIASLAGNRGRPSTAQPQHSSSRIQPPTGPKKSRSQPKAHSTKGVQGKKQHHHHDSCRNSRRRPHHQKVKA
ncbi:hypothetical protein SCAR479_03365 [Seiridium cardinale]|uniref:Uncharacterized protein n=1 Tax=Seiridium cardinale TaxID=138064 RepID=A0ABR2Y111_9PEZI